MTIDWPDTLPQSPLADGFRETLPDTALRTNMESGPAKIRRRGTTGISRMTLSFFLDAAGAAALAAFHDDTTAGGTLPFSFPHPRQGDTVSCRFIRTPEIFAISGGFFKTAIELEILP
jgi:hypothetical protein